MNRHKIIMRSAGFCLSTAVLLALGGLKRGGNIPDKNRCSSATTGTSSSEACRRLTKFATSVTAVARTTRRSPSARCTWSSWSQRLRSSGP